MSDASGKLERWSLRLSEFAFDIVHRAGFRNEAVDAHSKLSTVWSAKSNLNDEIPVLRINLKTFGTAFSAKFEHHEEEALDYRTTRRETVRSLQDFYALARKI